LLGARGSLRLMLLTNGAQFPLALSGRLGAVGAPALKWTASSSALWSSSAAARKRLKQRRASGTVRRGPGWARPRSCRAGGTHRAPAFEPSGECEQLWLLDSTSTNNIDQNGSCRFSSQRKPAAAAGGGHSSGTGVRSGRERKPALHRAAAPAASWMIGRIPVCASSCAHRNTITMQPQGLLLELQTARHAPDLC
jgi:hypothetical protein